MAAVDSWEFSLWQVFYRLAPERFGAAELARALLGDDGRAPKAGRRRQTPAEAEALFSRFAARHNEAVR